LKLTFGQSKKISLCFSAEGGNKKIGLQNFVLPELRSANFRIAERTLSLDLKNAWKIPAKFNAERRSREATNLVFSKCDNWRSFLDEVRTFFDENPNAEF